MWPAKGIWYTPDKFRVYINGLTFNEWKPIGIVWHNTASPNLKRWKEFSRDHWIKGLENYYKGLGWSGGPHLFVDDLQDGLGEFNQIDKRGTHSPSFNAQYIGIEHVGDYDTEDDDTGPGLSVKLNGIAATAILCAKLGINPLTNIKLHKEDRATTHKCPGDDMAQDKAKSIQAVIEYMSDGGEHSPEWAHVVDNIDNPVPTPIIKKSGVVTTNGLNVRSQSSMAGIIVARLNTGDKVVIVGNIVNGETKWLRIERPHNSFAWVTSKYIKEG